MTSSSSSSLPTLYGITQCDTCRKARRLLDELGVAHRFIDLRKDASDANGYLNDVLLTRFLAAADWETLLNRRSTTWRQLDDADKASLNDTQARVLLRAHPTLLKRPLLDLGDALLVGFDKSRYAALA